MHGDPVKVSVMVMTYNHGDWLRTCLESIVSQQTDFPFEILVGDDCSTDGVTGDIVRRFAASHPQMVRPFIREKNIGIKNNYYDLLSQCRGTYIAHMDGDDWMLPGKLQRQADFLDANATVAMVGHHVFGYYQKRFWKMPATAKGVIDLNQMLVIGCPFGHSSKMHRRAAIRDFWRERDIVDFYLHVEHARSGLVAVIDEYLTVYRLGVGISFSANMLPMITRAYMDAFDLARELSCDPVAIRRGECAAKRHLAVGHLNSGLVEGFRSLIVLSKGDWSFASRRHRIMHLLRYLPSLVRVMGQIRRFLILRHAGKVKMVVGSVEMGKE